MKNKMLPSLLLASSLALAAPLCQAEDSWLHIRVNNSTGDKEVVRVNVPLKLAEKVLPAIQVNKIHQGKLKIGNDNNSTSIDPRALMEAVRSTADGDFVTVDSDRQSVRVAKEAGYMVVKVRPGPNAKKAEAGAAFVEDKHRKHNSDNESVDVRIPLDVVEALLSGSHDELDIAAAVKALAAHHGDAPLVSVTDDTQTVRIWVDSKQKAD